jgi:hypothetical protein
MAFGHLASGGLYKGDLRIHHRRKILGFGLGKNLALRLAGQLREEIVSWRVTVSGARRCHGRTGRPGFRKPPGLLLLDYVLHPLGDQI